MEKFSKWYFYQILMKCMQASDHEQSKSELSFLFWPLTSQCCDSFSYTFFSWIKYFLIGFITI